MTIIYFMVFTPYFFPSLIVGREEYVCSLGGIIYLGKTQTVGYIHRLRIYACPPYYIYIVVVYTMLGTFLECAMPQSLVEGGIALATGEIGLSATEHYIPTIGQCALG